MKITAKQKKFWIPLILMVGSFACFISLLGSMWAVAFAPLFGIGVGSFGWYNQDLFSRINDWTNKDGLQ